MIFRFHGNQSDPLAGAGGRPLAARCVGYVAEPTAVHGAAGLFHQKSLIDGYAASRRMTLERYVVDSGGSMSPAGIPHGLLELLLAARRGSVDAVLVEHISRFAADYAIALRIAAALSSWGSQVHEACGGPAFIELDLAARLAIGELEASTNSAEIPRRRSRMALDQSF